MNELVTRCLVCNRKLKDAASIKRKIGQTCWRKLEKLTKIENQKKKYRKEMKMLANGDIKGQINMFEKLK